MREVLPGKYGDETKSYLFDFSSLAQPGESFTSVTAAAHLYSGVAGNPAVVATAGSITNNVVIVQVSGGIVGSIYVIVVQGTSSAGQVANLNAFLPILPGQP